MDDRSEWKQVLPFYMTHPMPGQWNFGSWEEEDAAMNDLEYMIEMYPRQAKKYQEKINRMLDTFDYRGSVIYDEYPDRLSLAGMADHIYSEISREEVLEEENQMLRELILVLLYYEIFRRRRNMYSRGGSFGWSRGVMSWPQRGPIDPWNRF